MAPPEGYTLSLHDALPIYAEITTLHVTELDDIVDDFFDEVYGDGKRITRISSGDRKSTRLNSSHVANSYAVFCLKQKNILRDTYIEGTGIPPLLAVQQDFT